MPEFARLDDLISDYEVLLEKELYEEAQQASESIDIEVRALFSKGALTEIALKDYISRIEHLSFQASEHRAKVSTEMKGFLRANAGVKAYKKV